MLMRYYGYQIIGSLLIITGLTACSGAAQAQDEPQVTARVEVKVEVEDECGEGPTNKQWAFSMGGLLIGTLVVAGVGVSTLSPSLAGGGYRQSAANMAGLGLGGFIGGGVGAGVMASSTCGVANIPGWISIAVSAIGLLVLVFSLATGRSR
jgi:hypothetical protein